ncbi:MAG: hypothetical protein ACM3ZC_02760 [Bacteroidota bacterium]
MRTKKVLTIAPLIIVSCLAVCEIGFRLLAAGAGHVRSTGGNAIWLRHAWVGEWHEEESYRDLAALLEEMRIADGYFHAGPLTAAGTVAPERIAHASRLLMQMRRHAPNLRLHAWLGQVEARAGGPLDLDSPEVRRALVATAETFLDMGFDGIHYDIEPIYSGDPSFLALLGETRALTAERAKLLAVAACRPEPLPGVEWLARRFARYPGYWRRDYYLRVAAASDQVAVMTYDSALWLPSLYGFLVAWITRWSVRNGVEGLLIGVPTYDECTASHLPPVESIATALRGMKIGLASLPAAERRKAGAALYAEWTTSEREREEYIRSWCAEPPD